MNNHLSPNDVIQVLQTLQSSPGGDEVERACYAVRNFITDKKSNLSRATYISLCRLLLEKITPFLTSSHSPASATLSSTNRRLITRLFDTCFLQGIPIVAFRELTTRLVKSSSHPSTDPNVDPRAVIARTLVLFVAHTTGGTQRLAQVIAHSDDADIEGANDTDVVNNLVHLPSRLLNILFSQSDTDDDVENAHLFSSIISDNDCNDNRTKLDSKGSTDTKLPLSEREYMRTLCEALYLQPKTSDIVRERVVRTLMSRIITLGYAPTLVSVLISHNDVTKAQELLKLAASSRAHALLRALFEAPVKSSHSEQFVRDVLACLVTHDRAARDACIYRIPFSRPLLRTPRLSLTRLVTTMCNFRTSDEDNIHDSVRDDALMTAIENWSDEAFALGADVSMQRQVTRLLLYYLRHTAASNSALRGVTAFPSSSVTLDIARGVQLRLDESDIRLRRHAMVIAEAASRHAGDPKPLSFDRIGLDDSLRSIKKTIGDNATDEDGDSDFSDIALSVGQPRPHDEKERNENVSPASVASDEKRMSKAASDLTRNDSHVNHGTEYSKRKTDKADSEQNRDLVVRYKWPCRELSDDWQGEDDWSSVDSFEQTSSEDEDRDPHTYRNEEALREKLHAPDSVGRLLAFIREMNNSDGGAVTIPPEAALPALRLIKSRADTRRGTEAFRIASLDLCLELSIFDPERYPDDTMDALKSARELALTAVLRLDIGVAGAGLVSQVVCGPSADVGRRLETLSILSNAVRLEAEFVNAQGTKVVRGLRRGTQLLAEQFVHVFHTIVSSFCAENAGNADFINVEGRDNELWARALIALAALARGAGATLEGSAMRKELLSVVLDRVAPSVRADVVVRRAMALVIGSVVDNMTENELSQAFRGSSNSTVIYIREAGVDEKDLSRLADRALEWLVATAEDDADVGVRRFAALGLRKWATFANAG